MESKIENPTNQVWDADDYNKSNGAQYRDAKELIEQIIKDGVTKADIIVDIGCGSGNVTKMLSSSIPHNKIYASDFDPQMVNFANKNHNDGTIEYFAQDIGVSWEHLDERLRKLEGSVDLVWSNRVLHWIPQEQKATAAKNIARLLKPKGRCYINITLLHDFSEFAKEEDKDEIREYTISFPHEEQFKNWQSFFRDSGLAHVGVKRIDKEWKFDTEEQYHQMFSASRDHFLRLTMNSNFFKLPNDKKKILEDKYFVKWLKFFSTKFGENPDTYEGDISTMFYQQFRVIGSK